LEAQVKKKTDIAFRWRAQGVGFDKTFVTTKTCNKVQQRSIPFPDCWRVALKCKSLPVIIDEAARKFRKETRMQVDCLLLGQPKHSKLPPADAGNVPGKVVALQIGSSRFEFLLCAHVRGDVWWCHRGSFLNDTFDAENPFDEKDLLLKDIFKASQELSQSRKRIRVHHRPGELREAALNSPDAWNRLVATSKWKAEELRAADQHRPIDKEDAFSNYEKNCWVWSTSDRVQIGVMWSWRVGNLQKRAVMHSRWDHLLARRTMNPPCDLGVSDADLLERLESIATSEMVRHRAPCQYLGLQPLRPKP
jgi:hypothetical protein